MARKRSATLTPEAPGDPIASPLPETNGTPPGETPVEQGEGPPSSPATKPATKKEAVQFALAAGVSMPKAIAKYVKEHFNMEVTPAHASTVKGGLNKKQGGAQANPKRGRQPKRREPADQQAPGTAAKRPAS